MPACTDYIMSCKLMPVEHCYAQIKKEHLASVWACEKFTHYLMGLDSFKLLTDHKPLVPLMTTKDLDLAPIRCQWLLMRLFRFNPVVQNVPDKDLIIADGLSCSPLPHTFHDEKAAEEILEYVDAIQALWLVSSDHLGSIQAATQAAPDVHTICNFMPHGMPRNSGFQPCLHLYEPFKGELNSVVDDTLTYQDRLVIPSSCGNRDAGPSA